MTSRYSLLSIDGIGFSKQTNLPSGIYLRANLYTFTAFLGSLNSGKLGNNFQKAFGEFLFQANLEITSLMTSNSGITPLKCFPSAFLQSFPNILLLCSFYEGMFHFVVRTECSEVLYAYYWPLPILRL